MEKNKEYEILEEDSQLLREPAAVSVIMDSRSDTYRTITGEELKARLHEGLKSLFV